MRKTLEHRIALLEILGEGCGRVRFLFRFGEEGSSQQDECVELTDSVAGRTYRRHPGEDAGRFAARISADPGSHWVRANIGDPVIPPDLAKMTDAQLAELEAIASVLAGA